MKGILQHLLLVMMLCIPFSASAQRIQNSNYGTVGYIGSDGRIQDSNYHTIGYINSDGRIQDSNYHTIGYAKDVPVSGAAMFFFFMKR